MSASRNAGHGAGVGCSQTDKESLTAPLVEAVAGHPGSERGRSKSPQYSELLRCQRAHAIAHGARVFRLHAPILRKSSSYSLRSHISSTASSSSE